MKYLVCAILAVCFLACDSDDPTGPGLDDEFTIRYGHSVTLARENLAITFKSVLEDSRCPTGAECVWEGNARVRR